MPQKKAVKQKKAAAPAAGNLRADPQTLEGWRVECERLRAELATSRAEILELRRRQEQVLNRIDWVLDSLDNLSQMDN